MFVSNQNKHGSLGPWTISKSAQTADLFNVNNNGGDGEILLCPGRKTHFDCDESRADSRLSSRPGSNETSYQNINYGLPDISDVSQLAGGVLMAGVSVTVSHGSRSRVTDTGLRDPCDTVTHGSRSRVTDTGSPMIKTVEFVTINRDPSYEDDASVSSSSR